MRRTLGAIIAGLVAVVGSVVSLGACAQDDPFSRAASDQLQAQVVELRRAAESGDAAQARASLADLQAAVATLRDQGEIDDERAQEILSAAAAVEQQLPTTMTSTTVVPPPPTSPPAPADDPSRGRSEGDKAERGSEGKKD